MRDQKLAETFRKMRCSVCGVSNGVVGHHIKTIGSGGKDVVENMMALCFLHHHQVHNMGLTTFIRRYPHLIPHLQEKGWELDEYSNKWIRLTKEGDNGHDRNEDPSTDKGASR